MSMHPLVHLALLAWYFLAKASLGRRRLALAMCAAGIAVAAADLVMLEAGVAGLPPGRVFLAAVIDGGLALLFAWRFVEALRREP